MVDREYHALALLERDYLRPRLHARPLFGEDELAAREIRAGFREQERDLEREDVLAVDVLMQAVVIIGTISKEERRRLGLPCFVAAVEESSVVFRIADIDP